MSHRDHPAGVVLARVDTQRPIFACWKVTVASALHARALDLAGATRSRPTGTSTATPARRPQLTASIAASSGARGAPSKPVPRIASTTSADAREGAPDAGRRDLRAIAARCDQAVVVRARVVAELVAAGHSSRRATSIPCSRSIRADREPVAAVVALAAHDRARGPSGERAITTPRDLRGRALHEVE